MRVVDRRIGLLFGLFLIALCLIALRTLWLDTVKAGSLRHRALSQQSEDITVSAKRGAILDRHGQPLAVSEDSASVYADPMLIKNPNKVAFQLSAVLGIPTNELLKKLADRTKGFVYLVRKTDISKGKTIDKMKIFGVGTLTEPRRRYPQGFLASQVLGTVGTDNNGLSGLESRFDSRLHGTDGEETVVKDALGRPVSIVMKKQAVAGQDLRLTLDAAVQERVEAVLAGVGQTYRPKGATALVLDPRNGSILALANWPRVDANNPGGAPAYAQQDRAVTDSYEPGSTFKAFTVSGALQDKLITPDTPFYLPAAYEVADRTIKDAEPRGDVTLTVKQILAQSSNVGAVKIGQRLGADRFDKWVRSFGFGKPTGVDLPGESPGIVLHPNQYSGSSLGNLPIGQGEAVTPIQMAAAYSAIANDGVMVRPHIVAGDLAPSRRVIKKSTAESVSKMLEGVLAPGGTAPEATVPGYVLAGKTGTAQKPDGKGGYSDTKFVASFVGFAPARNPRLLVAVMVDEPQGDIYGGSVAAPAFQKIVSFALPYLKIPPN
ncbi:MAG TPA: penicillin-binding protein 2 [Thermoleophilaceae bacterium]|jgi:cell division protein FtsI/penicillin-binding protein 2